MSARQVTREDFDTARKIRAQMWFIYPFFGVHMLAFGLSGFFMAYGAKDVDLKFLYMHGGLAIFVYLTFYATIFGRDEVRWMFTNAALGILGIYAQINWILARFGKSASDYSWKVHVIPILYYVLYTFLLRQFLLDLTNSRDNATRRDWVNRGYVAISVLVYAILIWRESGHA